MHLDKTTSRYELKNYQKAPLAETYDERTTTELSDGFF